MKINDVKKIVYDEGTMEVLIEIQLDAETTNRWELEDPNALVTYKPFDKLRADNIELIDRGIKVHGYEFNEKEEEEISNFIKENVLQ